MRTVAGEGHSLLPPFSSLGVLNSMWTSTRGGRTWHLSIVRSMRLWALVLQTPRMPVSFLPPQPTELSRCL